MRDGARLVLLELGVGAVNGAVIGLVTAIAAYPWKGNPWLGLDPAQSSGTFLTTVTDAVGFFSFLGFATIVPNRLLGL